VPVGASDNFLFADNTPKTSSLAGNVIVTFRARRSVERADQCRNGSGGAMHAALQNVTEAFG